MKSYIRNVIIIGGIILLLAGIWFFREIVVYILVSGVLSIMGRPLVDLLTRAKYGRIGIPKTIAALITLAVIWGLIVLFFYIFIPLISAQIDQFSSIESSKLVNLIEEPIKQIEALFRAFGTEVSSDISVQDYINSKVSGVLNANFLQNFISSLAGIMGNIIVAFFSISFITFFFLKDQHLFFESIVMWVPDRYVDNVTRALYSVKHLLTRYFIGILIQSTCIMILITTGMTIAGIEFRQAVVMGLIVGILNIIPYVGPWLGFFISITMGIASHINQDWNSVIIPLVWYMVLVVAITQTIDNVVFQPVIFSNSVRAHPLEIFIVVLAAGFAAGVPGMILGIPTYTVLRVFAKEFFNNFKAVRKITSSLDTGGAGGGAILIDLKEPPVGNPEPEEKK